jgi:hypothetical protein
MATVINFQEYVNAKEEEKRRLKRISSLMSRKEYMQKLAYSIKDSIGCSFITKDMGEMNQVIGREHILDDDLRRIVMEAIRQHNIKVQEEIEELSGCGMGKIPVSGE